MGSRFFAPELHADSAVTDEPAGLIEHRLTAHVKLLLRAVGIDAAEDEIQERLPGCNDCLQRLPFRLVPAWHLSIVGVSHQGVDPDSEHLQDRTGDFGEVPVLVLLPVPVGRQLGEAAIAGFALAQFGGAFLHRLLQHLAVVLEPFVQQPHFQHVVDARLDFDQIEGLADEILRASLQRAQLVPGLSGNHQDRKIAVRVVCFQAFDHLESIHPRHLQVEHDQVVALLAMQRAYLVRIHGRRDAGVAGLTQHLLEQPDIDLLIVHDQDAGVEYVRLDKRHACSSMAARLAAICECISARSSASMNWSTLMGLVR